MYKMLFIIKWPRRCSYTSILMCLFFANNILDILSFKKSEDNRATK